MYPLGALTVGLKGETITEMVELTEAGCVGCFSQADNPIVDTRTLQRALQYATIYGYTVRPQDAYMSKGGAARAVGRAGVGENYRAAHYF